MSKNRRVPVRDQFADPLKKNFIRNRWHKFYQNILAVCNGICHPLIQALCKLFVIKCFLARKDPELRIGYPNFLLKKIC